MKKKGPAKAPEGLKNRRQKKAARAKRTAGRSSARKVAKKAAAKKAPAKRSIGKKATAKKTPSKKTTAKKKTAAVKRKKVAAKAANPPRGPRKASKRVAAKKAVLSKAPPRKTARRSSVGGSTGLGGSAWAVAAGQRIAAAEAAKRQQAAASEVASKAEAARAKSEAAAAKKLLQRALAAAGGSRARLARALEVTPAKLTRWLDKGPPASELSTVEAARQRLAEHTELQGQSKKQVAKNLKAALKFAESPQGLVKVLGGAAAGVTLADVKRWQRSGLVPLEHQPGVVQYVQAQEQLADRAKNARRLYRELMLLAKAKGITEDHHNHNKTREGPLTLGHSWKRVFESELSLDLIDSIETWLQKVKSSKQAKWPLWQIMAIVSEFGEAAHIGYGQDPTQLGRTEHEGDFVVDQLVSGRVWNTFDQAQDAMREGLEEGADRGLFIMVHAVVVNNFRRKSDEERRAYETAARKKRDAEKKRKGQAV